MPDWEPPRIEHDNAQCGCAGSTVAIGSGVIERVLCDDLSRQRTFICSIHIAAIRVQCQGSEAARDSLTDVRRRPD